MFIQTLFFVLMPLANLAFDINARFQPIKELLPYQKALHDLVNMEKQVYDDMKKYINGEEARLMVIEDFQRSRPEFFSATTDMISLIETHAHVVYCLRVYLEKCNDNLQCNQEKNKLDILRRYLKIFEKEHEKMKLQKKRYVGNPLNAYTLIHHLTEELYVIQQYSKIEKYLRRESLPFPSAKDWEGAATGIWRLQVVYNMSITSLANGKLNGTYRHDNKLFEEESTPLSTSALYGVGRAAFNNKDYDMALSWLHEALSKYYGDDPDETYVYDESYIVDGIRHAYHGVGDFGNAIIWTKKMIEMRPHAKDLNENLTFYQTQLENNRVLENCGTPLAKNDSFNDKDETFVLYQTLCRGDIPVPEHKRKSLNCYYKFGPSPFLRLAPMKTEMLHLEPELYLFHDAISDREIIHFKKRSHMLFKRSSVVQPKNDTAVNYRISKSAWIFDEESAAAARISKRVSDMSGLDTSLAEHLQICNYGIGGHFSPHLDSFPKSVSRIGKNRIATAMFYMSDVELGGATVFLGLQLTVFPMKNAAIFWRNLLSSGEADFLTKHGACPVVRGSKWVANKWLHEAGQELIHPCKLEYEDNSNLALEGDRKFYLSLVLE